MSLPHAENVYIAARAIMDATRLVCRHCGGWRADGDLGDLCGACTATEKDEAEAIYAMVIAWFSAGYHQSRTALEFHQRIMAAKAAHYGKWGVRR